ncbi:uncharacterized protein BO97DRAFT_419189 [Aspergillus homomorphus CBS 101889]|uniref:Uncharacterized protein n=1 Tax=Aspergillus homomorphus (strain CBS 101889) TaxID=1450537 RepID=A0A395HIC5_ASPHC|nr:hypothetical protein BO97DRAFT_419189 [Aspergillus homomorphus CBS 101889]RAL06728.1 hypothetical protein BO97DRAFT_419189 [Aspergillus homomorphus CBS 101889]
MTKAAISLHVLEASIDLEGRKTGKQKVIEDSVAQAHPKHASDMRSRGCQKKSLQLVETIARYLSKTGMTDYWICCGYNMLMSKWRVSVIFGKEGMSNEARMETRGQIIARFLGVQPDRDTALVKNGEDLSARRKLLQFTSIREPSWFYLTRLRVQDGLPVYVMGDGIDYTKDVAASAKEADKGSVVTLREALRIMKQPSRTEWLEQMMICPDPIAANLFA